MDRRQQGPARFAEGADPTEELPDELLLLILLHVVHIHHCITVCRRWHRLCLVPPVKQQLRTVYDTRWADYVSGRRKPRDLVGADSSYDLVTAGSRVFACNLSRHAVLSWRIPKLRRSDEQQPVVPEVEEVFHNTGSDFYAFALGPNGTVVTGEDYGVVRVWSASTGEMLRTLRDGGSRPVECVAVSTRGIVYAICIDSPVHSWDSITGVHSGTFGNADVGGLLLFSDDLLCTAMGNTVVTWDTTTHAQVKELKGHTASVTVLARGVEGTNEVLSGGDDNTVRVWNIHTGTQLRVLEGRCKGGYITLAVNHHGRIFAAGDLENHLAWVDETNVIDIWGSGDSSLAAASIVITGAVAKIVFDEFDQMLTANMYGPVQVW